MVIYGFGGVNVIYRFVRGMGDTKHTHRHTHTHFIAEVITRVQSTQKSQIVKRRFNLKMLFLLDLILTKRPDCLPTS